MNLFKFNKIIDEKEYTTYLRTFENYRWYKPILVLALGALINFALTMALNYALELIPGFYYQIYNSAEPYSLGAMYPTLMNTLLIPSFYIASKLIYKNSFSSQVSSTGGWKWDVYLKVVFIALCVYGADALIKTFVNGYSFTNNFTIITFVVCLLLTMTQSFAEEYVYRGFLMQALGSWIKVPIIAIVLQSLFFLHTQFDWIMMLVTLVIGLLFGFMAWYGKGLEISSAMHFSFNYILILSTGFTTGSFLPNSNLDYFMYIVLPIIIITIIIFMDYKFNWFGFRENKGSNS